MCVCCAFLFSSIDLKVLINRELYPSILKEEIDFLFRLEQLVN